MAAEPPAGEQHTSSIARSSIARSSVAGALAGRDMALYALVVLVWGTSWLGMRMQVGVVAPEVSVLWRFVLACPIMFVWATLARQPLVFPRRAHARFAAMGATMFSTNLILFYHASLAIPSGLMAVVFSLASIFNASLGAIFLGQRLERSVVLAGAVGVLGVMLMFAPEIIGHEIDRQAIVGLIECVAATACFCLGNIVSASSQRIRLPVLASTAWGMVYGIGFLVAVSLWRGNAFIVEPTVRYLAALGWLAIVASVVAFSAFLTLVGRVGPARAGYMTILFPVVALMVSTVFEGYRWTALAALGLLLVLAGNWLVLRRRTA